MNTEKKEKSTVEVNLDFPEIGYSETYFAKNERAAKMIASKKTIFWQWRYIHPNK